MQVADKTELMTSVHRAVGCRFAPHGKKILSVQIRLVSNSKKYIPIQDRPASEMAFQSPFPISTVKEQTHTFSLPALQPETMRLIGLMFFTVATLAATSASTTGAEGRRSQKKNSAEPEDESSLEDSSSALAAAYVKLMNGHVRGFRKDHPLPNK